MLLQLPPGLAMDLRRLDVALQQFPPDIRVAVEFRHRSWYTGEVRRLLEGHHAALCLADRRGPLTPTWVTTDWTYVRFHEGKGTPAPCYRPSSLAKWARRLAKRSDSWREAFVYFNNDPRCCAVHNAIAFAHETERLGLAPTRVPPLDAVHVVE